MNIKCIVVDDEPLALELMKSYVEKTPFLTLVGSYSNSVDAMSSISSEQPDLIFLDIQMPDMNGLDFSKVIGDKCRVIFTTAFEQYALESYKVNALDYLLKPISYPDFLKSASKAQEWFQLKNNTKSVIEENPNEKKTILVKSDYKILQIELNRILYIEGLKDYVKIVLEDTPQPILSLMSMKMLEEELPSDRFIRVHRSFIVQPSKIYVIERNRIVFGKQYIPISDSYRDKFQDYMNTHAMMGFKN